MEHQLTASSLVARAVGCLRRRERDVRRERCGDGVRRVRVLILTPFYPPAISGAGRYVAEVAAALASAGHDVEVLNASGVDATPIPGVVARTVSGRLRGSTSLVLLWRAVGAHRRESVDVVVTGVAFPMGVVAAMVARVVRRPLVVLAMGEDVAIGDASRTARIGLRRVFATASRVIAISNYTKATAVRLGASANDCCVIAPGIDAAALLQSGPAERRTFRQHHGLDDRRIVLTVARLEDRKGHDTVLSAVAGLATDFDDVHYLIVGSGDPTALRMQARVLRIEDRLTIIERLPADELVQAYAAADVFAMVSRPGARTEVDGFGIVYLEAAAAGLACIAGNQGGCTDAVITGTTGLSVDPLSVPAVETALRQVLSSGELANRLGAAGRHHVLTNHQLGRSQARLRDTIVDVAHARTARP
jgi:phosphatidylinositol alpha-1,6-mannosyltransferase